MKSLFVLFFLMLCLSVSARAQEVGVNFNGDLDYSDPEALNRIHTTWVRGFLNFFPYYNDPGTLEEDPDLGNFLYLKDQGFKTILNIKYNFSNKAIPALGSDKMANYKAFMQEVLDKIWGHVDVVVVGNEPFIESRQEDRNGPLVDFYQEMCRVVNNYRLDKQEIPIYFGAFNRLYDVNARSSGVNSMLAFVKGTSWIAGIDLHIHHKEMGQMVSMIEYSRDRIRPQQSILITEFSFIWFWKAQMGETIPAFFSNAYGYNANWKNYEYINYAVQDPRPKEEWTDFLENSSWFFNNKHYLWDSYQIFKNYPSIDVATYSYNIKFSGNFTASTNPWLLNSLYTSVTVEPDPETGAFQLHYAFFEDFKRILADTSGQDTTSTGFRWPEGDDQSLQFINPVGTHLKIDLSEEERERNFYVYNLNGKRMHAFRGNTTYVGHLLPAVYILYDRKNNRGFRFIKK